MQLWTIVVSYVRLRSRSLDWKLCLSMSRRLDLYGSIREDKSVVDYFERNVSSLFTCIFSGYTRTIHLITTVDVDENEKQMLLLFLLLSLLLQRKKQPYLWIFQDRPSLCSLKVWIERTALRQYCRVVDDLNKNKAWNLSVEVGRRRGTLALMIDRSKQTVIVITKFLCGEISYTFILIVVDVNAMPFEGGWT